MSFGGLIGVVCGVVQRERFLVVRLYIEGDLLDEFVQVPGMADLSRDAGIRCMYNLNVVQAKYIEKPLDDSGVFLL